MMVSNSAAGGGVCVCVWWRGAEVLGGVGVAGEVEEIISQLGVLTSQNASHLVFLCALLRRPRGTPFSGKRGELPSDHAGKTLFLQVSEDLCQCPRGGSSWKKKTSWLGCKDF